MADAKQITVIIDGIQVQVPEGTYVWDACRKIGMEIPNFCYIPGLRAYGACRMCVVEVSGRRGFELVTSCSTPAADGMEVRTINDRIWQQRNMIMEALDTDHPVDCPICEANGDCRLQDYGYEYGVVGTDNRRPKIVRPSERLSPAIDLDRDRCVVCGRCVRECDEVVGAVALAFVERGLETLIDAPFGKSLLETPCTSCGMCVELCPVGALSSRLYNGFKYEHHWWQRKTDTTCTHCSVGCTIKLGTTRNQMYEVRTDDQLGLNDGVTCVKGRFGMDFINSNNRLSVPLVRREGRLVPTTWDDALGLVASKLKGHRGVTGVVASTKLTNEENYLLQKVVRVGLGTNNIDWDGRAQEAQSLGVLHDMLGYPAQTNNLIDTRQKAGCVLAVGGSFYETHPVYAYQMQRMIRLTDKKLVVISPTWNKLCEWATLWLAPQAGTEDVLVHAMARVIGDAELQDDAFLESRAEGSTEYLESLAADEFSLEEVSRHTGVPAKDIVAAAYLYVSGGSNVGPENLPEPTHPSNLPVSRNGAAEESAHEVEDEVLASRLQRPEGGFPPSTIVFPASGPYILTQPAVSALVNLALLTGNIGRSGGGVNPLVSDSNSLGANDMGCQPDYFPGYRPVNADNAREMEELWGLSPEVGEGVEISGEPGLDMAGMIAAAETGDLKALWVIGSNPVLSMEEPDSDRVREALRKLDFLVVQDIFNNETAEFADVILPASSYAEKEGTYTNTERRVQRVRQAIEPVGASKPDHTIISTLGQRLGVSLPATEPREVLEEIARVVPQYAGISYARLDMTEFIEDAIPMPAAVSYKQLKLRSLMWPCPDRLHPGTPVLYTDGFATGSGKAAMSLARPATTPAPTMEAPAGGALMATLGFPLFPFRTGTLSRHSYGLSTVEPDSRLHLNSADAALLGIGDQMPVHVTVEGAQATDPIYAVSLIYDRVPEGRAFLAITMEQAGTNAAVREARHMLQSGERRAVPIRVQPAPNMAQKPMSELQTAATGNVLQAGVQPL